MREKDLTYLVAIDPTLVNWLMSTYPIYGKALVFVDLFVFLTTKTTQTPLYFIVLPSVPNTCSHGSISTAAFLIFNFHDNTYSATTHLQKDTRCFHVRIATIICFSAFGNVIHVYSMRAEWNSKDSRCVTCTYCVCSCLRTLYCIVFSFTTALCFSVVQQIVVPRSASQSNDHLIIC